MIISASRRTDIPAFYSDWFFNRIDSGEVLVPNPMNPHQISRIKLSPEVIDCIVFWSKNPSPMLANLDKLADYKYYFQFTLNGYDRDIEPSVPEKSALIETFRRLSDQIGPDRVVWRYDPIIFSSKYSIDYHFEHFNEFASQLSGYTNQCTISFVDSYTKNAKRMSQAGIGELNQESILTISSHLKKICDSNNLKLQTCSEQIDLAELGIEHAHCIDERIIARIIGKPVKAEKDKNQRRECGCISSVDIGIYNTCLLGCQYCYANYSEEQTKRNYAMHDPKSPLLIGNVGADDIVKDRAMKSIIVDDN